MQRLSISRAWDEAKAVLAQDRGPIAAVALALLVLPGTIGELVVPPGAPGTSPGFGWSLVGVAVLLVSILGQLTVSTIALGRRQSVGEAIAHGARRSPAFLLATLIWLLPFVLAVSPFALQLQANPTEPPPGPTLAVLLISLVFLFFAVRLVLSAPIAVAEGRSGLGILKRSWELTAGNWWRLFGFLIVYMAAALILLGAVTAALGTVVGLIGGEPERLSVGALIIALVSQLVAAAITVLLTVILTRLYLQSVNADEAPVSVPNAP